MDYTIDPQRYLINEAKDNHLVKGEPLEAGEGLIAILKKCDETLYSHRSIVLYRDTTQDTDANAAWCTKATLDDGTIEYTLVATTPINEELVIGGKVYDGADEYGEIYFIGKEETNWYEFTLQYIEKHVFVEKGAILAPELLAMIEKLYAMKADKLIEDMLIEESENYATIDGPAKLNPNEPKEYTITYNEESYKTDEVVDYDYTVEIYTLTGKKAPASVKANVTNKTKDSCFVEIVGTIEGVYKVDVKYTWHEQTTGDMRLLKTPATISSWFDPIIMVDSAATYDQLNSYGMVMSIATVDLSKTDSTGAPVFTPPISGGLDIFANHKDITKEQMVNPEALKITLQAGMTTASARKIAFLKSLGLTQLQAEELSLKFMTLAEGMAVTNIGTAFGELPMVSANVLSGSFNPLTSTVADLTTVKLYPIQTFEPDAPTYTDGPFASKMDFYSKVNPATDTLNSIYHFESFAYFTHLNNIPDQAFYCCTNLSQIFIPVTIETVGSQAFFGCRSLANFQTLID